MLVPVSVLCSQWANPFPQALGRSTWVEGSEDRDDVLRVRCLFPGGKVLEGAVSENTPERTNTKTKGRTPTHLIMLSDGSWPRTIIFLVRTDEGPSVDGKKGTFHLDTGDVFCEGLWSDDHWCKTPKKQSTINIKSRVVRRFTLFVKQNWPYIENNNNNKKKIYRIFTGRTRSPQSLGFIRFTVQSRETSSHMLIFCPRVNNDEHKYITFNPLYSGRRPVESTTTTNLPF